MLPEYAYNLFPSNKWLAIIPFKAIYDDLSTPYVALNLQKVTLPEFGQKTTDFYIKGENIPIPVHTRGMQKNASFSFLLSSNWHQYSIMYRWLNNCTTKDNIPSETQNRYFLDIDICILSEFKKPMFSFVLRNAFITRLGKVEMDYTNPEPVAPVPFDVAFSMMEFDDRFPDHSLNQG